MPEPTPNLHSPNTNFYEAARNWPRHGGRIAAMRPPCDHTTFIEHTSEQSRTGQKSAGIDRWPERGCAGGKGTPGPEGDTGAGRGTQGAKGTAAYGYFTERW
ncbi:hypothetical protein GCM10010358_09170 [Streptomyces minutiscleroticus]|uniref:Uncharacterized protein n=1 Tax=Streptomyces minutiscleroticus TaxID=68238 RepID=A0A918KB36_9ACTN|nr:hypothetical protein GCM10010358_09170 [Streptomyces minutiscleroticus]